MTYEGTARLNRREAPEALAFEVFDLELDDAGWAEMAPDPAAFVRELLASNGISSAGIWNDELLNSGGTTTASPRPPAIQVYHCIAPPEHVSKSITIVIGPTPS